MCTLQVTPNETAVFVTPGIDGGTKTLYTQMFQGSEFVSAPILGSTTKPTAGYCMFSLGSYFYSAYGAGSGSFPAAPVSGSSAAYMWQQCSSLTGWPYCNTQVSSGLSLPGNPRGYVDCIDESASFFVLGGSDTTSVYNVVVVASH